MAEIKMLGIVIINYRTPEMVINCLQAVVLQLREIPDSRVVVVDNASGDDSSDRIKQAILKNGWNELVELVCSPVNAGFSAGNNIGIKHVQAKSYLLLNSDTLLRSGALVSLLNAAEQRLDAGIIGPRLEWPDGKAQGSCFRFRHPGYEFFKAASTGVLEHLFRTTSSTLPISDEPMKTPWISFACVLVRHDVIQRVGLLDEGFFMYEEDKDYCRQVRKHGWEVLYWPAARVVHLRGGSSPVKSRLAERKRPPRYYYASRSRYFAKHYGMFGLWVANILWMVGRSISFTRESIGGKKTHVSKSQWRDIWTNIFHPMQRPILQGKEKI